MRPGSPEETVGRFALPLSRPLTKRGATENVRFEPTNSDQELREVVRGAAIPIALRQPMLGPRVRRSPCPPDITVPMHGAGLRFLPRRDSASH
jgi:hypothetical protein